MVQGCSELLCNVRAVQIPAVSPVCECGLLVEVIWGLCLGFGVRFLRAEDWKWEWRSYSVADLPADLHLFFSPFGLNFVTSQHFSFLLYFLGLVEDGT